MIVPTRSEFATLARDGRLVPIYREVFADHDTPVSAFRKIDDGGDGFLLESVEGGEKWGRYSLLGARPESVFVARGERCELRRGGRTTALTRHPVEELGELLRAHQAVPLPGLPRFCGGAVGYLGYDAVRWFERLPVKTKDDLALPDAVFLFGDVVSVFDNLTHTLKVVTHARGGADLELRGRRSRKCRRGGGGKKKRCHAPFLMRKPPGKVACPYIFPGLDPVISLRYENGAGLDFVCSDGI